ncbi:hypothetical protein CHUAL_006239 [Chamberlinius hualienensis]
MADAEKLFAQFCPYCESLLRMPNVLDNKIVCRVCKQSTDASVFDGMETYAECVLNPYDPIDWNKNRQKDSAATDGPLVDRKCSRCGHEGMFYTTLQLRSADEGQTVFYTCQKCRFKEIENS